MPLRKTVCVLLSHLGKPKKVLGDGRGAAMDLHKWDLSFSCHQDVLLVMEDSRQVHTPIERDIR